MTTLKMTKSRAEELIAPLRKGTAEGVSVHWQARLVEALEYVIEAEPEREIVAAMKANSQLRLTLRNGRKLLWADDKQQWEVYTFDGHYPIWHYKGDSLTEALAALLEDK